ncbi:FAD-dependent monooxygenase [Actinosynnema sp. NPDC047251]|uniref:FAD dependent oxidoreductase n=1 Tax=Saccharothrix espanaensis (strain ATCC 51144 / DSM 44229 / JCM 9112 / NBRC 15066 / NRRL 15764) TaxID=1179773 RepID=K0K0E5_SACES|nr:FAD-dependent monooxygenase [Saccharothrix espanaensis]CCH31007.1 FAD dependent oxidoreductase [Saccharothrix espanaensis DSM 44229]
MKNTTVLISGAGIGGPALAHWLHRLGCTVTVVEKASAPRPGGQAVDFKGPTHERVLTLMGLLDDIKARQTGGIDQTIVDGAGRRLAVLPGEFTGGAIEIRRGDLAALLHERTTDACEYVFGDAVTSLTETPDGVHVTFEQAAPRTFDLVVGADGIHSAVRRLAFGPERDHVRHLGHYYALVDLGDLGDEALMYNEPGRMVAVGGSKAPAFFVFAADELTYDRYDVAAQREILREHYRGGGWRLPELMASIGDATSVYVDAICRVETTTYAKGRVALLGDAGYGNTLGGFGSGLAIVGAYVLAGELAAADGDHRVAFARYEERLRGLTKVTRKANAGPFLAPGTAFRIRMRNGMFNSRLMMRVMLRMSDRMATDPGLPPYPLPVRA